MTKYIFITGGVISGLGKGVASASIGAILQMLGETNITIKKLDPYLNVDAGTMNPIEHGEVFVTDDGTETDLDLGYYERFLEIITTNRNSTSSGKLYQKLIEKERSGDYLGKTVQMIPHFTNIIKEFISYNKGDLDYILCEIGGTVGDIEASAFFEALRQFKNDVGIQNVLFIHLTYLLFLPATNELKTKPTQNTIRDLQQVGIVPDILICRSEIPIPLTIKEKLSLHTNLPIQNIISAVNAHSIYQVPLNFISEGLHLILSDKMDIQNPINTIKWRQLNHKLLNLTIPLKIGIVGKYTELNDSYKSILESIYHAGIYHNCKINVDWINSRVHGESTYEGIDGVLIPGGFGDTGIENMISLIQVTREKNLPTFGICLGMQLMVIEYCRNVLRMENAGSEEFGNFRPNVISKMKQWSSEDYGGTMRLGKTEITIDGSSKAFDIYGKNKIHERHRHRYDVNDKYLTDLESNGLKIVGRCSDHNLVEVVEMDEKIHPWYIGCQYHPEFQSSPFNPHPLFVSFINRSIHQSQLK